jgi:hypothetical protein
VQHGQERRRFLLESEPPVSTYASDHLAGTQLLPQALEDQRRTDTRVPAVLNGPLRAQLHDADSLAETKKRLRRVVQLSGTGELIESSEDTLDLLLDLLAFRDVFGDLQTAVQTGGFDTDEHERGPQPLRAVGIFPSVDPYLRLVAAYLIEYADDWSTSRGYIHPQDVQQQESRIEMTP